MTNYKIITEDEETKSSSSSKTIYPSENRKRHKPVKGLPRM